MARRKEMKLNQYFTFGRYKGRPLGEVIERSPQYIDWALKDKVISLAPEAIEPFEQEIARRIIEVGYRRLSDKQFNREKANTLAVIICQQNQKGITMNKKVVLVIHTNDKKDTLETVDGSTYSYFTDLPDAHPGMHVVLDTQRSIQFGIISKVEGLTPSQITRAEQWIIGAIDLNHHNERLKIQEKAQELMNVLEDEAKNFDRMQVFARMAESSPRINQLVHELNSLDDTLMPKAVLQGLPEPEKQTVDTVFEDETETDNDIY